jgi:DNA-3-methyladenine glycosylase I
MTTNRKQERCAWAGNDPLMTEYHDKEWGTPFHDDRLLFEFLILEGIQAGLSWSIILQKRENYRRAFDNFDIPKLPTIAIKKSKNCFKTKAL